MATDERLEASVNAIADRLAAGEIGEGEAVDALVDLAVENGEPAEPVDPDPPQPDYQAEGYAEWWLAVENAGASRLDTVGGLVNVAKVMKRLPIPTYVAFGKRMSDLRYERGDQ